MADQLDYGVTLVDALLLSKDVATLADEYERNVKTTMRVHYLYELNDYLLGLLFDKGYEPGELVIGLQRAIKKWGQVPKKEADT